jgi:hypothetical protein
MFGIYEFAFADDEYKQDMEYINKKCPNKDLACMDKELKSLWPSLDNETKSEFIAYATTIKSG